MKFHGPYRVSKMSNFDDPKIKEEEIDEELRATHARIENYFVQGKNPDDIISLWELKQKKHHLEAFTTLFRGPENFILIRLLFLKEMALKGNSPSWALNELRHVFGYLTEQAFDYTIKKLREGCLIDYDRESNSYKVTSLGLKVYSSIHNFLKSDEDEALGMLTGLVYAGEITDTFGKEELAHLLYRLNQLQTELVDAIESSSEDRILKARDRFEAVWRYIEKGTAIIERIAKNSEMDRGTHMLAQQIGFAQSGLANFTCLFQRSLNDIDKQRIHLGNSGVSTTDLNKYLMSRNIEELLKLIEDVIAFPVDPVFILTDIMADVAEAELEKETDRLNDFVMPQLVNSPVAELSGSDGIERLKELFQDVSSIEERVEFKDIIPRKNYEQSCYRLSMVSLLGGTSDTEAGSFIDFVNCPVEATFDSGVDNVFKHGVKTISRGFLSKPDK